MAERGAALEHVAVRRRRWVPRAGAKTEAAAQILSPIVLLLLWEVAARVGWVDQRFFPAPSAIVRAFWEAVTTGVLLHHLKITLWRVVLGTIIGGVPAVLIGLAMGLWRWLRLTLDPIIAATYPLPKSALFPLLLLIFGLGEGSKVSMVAIGVFYLAVTNAMEGVLAISPVYFDVAKTFGARRWDVIRTVALPGAMPLVLAGLRLGVGTGLILGVLAEMLGARDGLGYLLWSAWQTFSVSSLWATLFVTAILGFVSVQLVDFLRKVLVPWQRTSGRT
ncbi:ABC transporter permease [Thermomicrobium sp. 4228-Ro]|uniref:ABC transporter permease n=1 Tax=Thermomicrobium sp. 4228-Ro TaxID=2993937 RepID=UPI0022494097|nr:ABC transporter permease [Thermomicrobium sp. 4228-Ro]MCX2726536.1 ABC transporter permease [Thermomicrobium sp. 4228-Ro]